MNDKTRRIVRLIAPGAALAVMTAAVPAHADWQSVRTEGGMAAFSNDGKPAVPALIAVCQRGTVYLYVNLAMDPQRDSRTIGFRGQSSLRYSEENFVRDAGTGSWVTQPGPATLALFNDDEFTLSVTLNEQSIAGITMQGYNDQGPDPEKGINAAIRPVFAACPNWRQQASAAIAPSPAAEQAGDSSRKPKERKAAAPKTARTKEPAPIARPPAQTEANPSRIPLEVGYYAYVEGSFSTCAKPVLPPWYFDGARFWEESDVTDPNHEYTPQAVKWEMVAADRFRISYRSRDERGQWDSMVSVNEYLITGPQSFTYVGTVGGPMNANERHQLCAAAQLPAKARWFRVPK